MHRRHDPTYYWATRRLPREIRPATHALYGYVRTADEIVDGPRRPASAEARRAALDAWERELHDGLAQGRSPHPVVGALVDAGRPPPPAARRAAHVHALDAHRLRARADRHAGRSSRPTWTARPARSGGSWRRCSACRSAITPASAASGRPSSSPTSSATCARTRALDRDLPARRRPRRASASRSADLARGTASPELRALLALEVRRARGLFAEAEPAIAAAPALRAHRRPLRRRRLPARARPRRADRLRRARPAAPRCGRGSCPAPRSGRCGDDAARDAARRGAHAARRHDARRRARSAARASPGSPWRASWRARAPTCSWSTATRSASARPPPARRRRRGCTRWASSGSIRQELPCMAFHTPHGSARFRLPWSWSSFDYRTLCEELWAQCGDARFEIAKVEGRAAATSSSPTAATLAAPLIVDALGWRRVLGPGANVQPPEAPISRGLEVHPDGGGDRPRRLDRPLADPHGLRLVGPGGRRAARRRRLLRAARPRQGADEGDRRPPRRRRRCATRATGSRTRCARRPRTASSSSATARATASRSRARGSAPRSTSASPAGASCARVLAGEATREQALAAYGAFSARHAPRLRGSPCASSG